MSYTFKIRRLDARPYVGIRRLVKPQKLGEALADILPAVGEFLRQRGLRAASPPMTLYHGHDEVKGVFDIQGGVFLLKAIPTEGRFEAGEIPAGEAASTVHIGPYEKLGEAHGAIATWIREQGRTPAAPCWEVYLNDPGEVRDPAKFKTEVVWPISARS